MQLAEHERPDSRVCVPALSDARRGASGGEGRRGAARGGEGEARRVGPNGLENREVRALGHVDLSKADGLALPRLRRARIHLKRRVVVGDRARQRAHPLEERGAREQRTGVRRAELNVISCCVRACATDTSHPAPLKLFKEPSMERVLARRTYY